MTNRNEKLLEIEQRLENLKQGLADLQEDSEITRCAVNLLLDWAEDPGIQKVPVHERKAE